MRTGELYILANIIVFVMITTWLNDLLGNNEVDKYQALDYNTVPHDPSFEEMKKVVGQGGQRLPISRCFTHAITVK